MATSEQDLKNDLKNEKNVEQEIDKPAVSSYCKVNGNQSDPCPGGLEPKLDPDAEPSTPEPRANMKEQQKNKVTNFPLSSVKCPKCRKIYRHPLSLTHHLELHRGETKCNICGRILATNYSLKMHKKAKHS